MLIEKKSADTAVAEKNDNMPEFDTLVNILERSDEIMAIADSRLRIRWYCNDAFFMNAKLYKNNIGELFIADKDSYIPVDSIRTKLDGRVFYILKMQSDKDLVKLFKTQTFDMIYSRYRNRLTSRLSSYIEYARSDDLKMQKIDNIKYHIRDLNTAVKSDVANFEEYMTLTSGDMKTDFFSISEQLGLYLDIVKETAKYNGYEFDYCIDHFIAAEINVDRFKCALSNLIANAYKYNDRPDKKVKIEIYADDIYFYVDIIDNGKGFDEQTLEKTKVPFSDFGHRGTLESPENSEGLGIYLARLYANELGGDLVYDMTDEGFCAKLSFRKIKDKNRKGLRMLPAMKYSSFFEPEFIILSKALRLIPLDL